MLPAERVREIFQKVKSATRYGEMLQARDAARDDMLAWIKPGDGGLQDDEFREKFTDYYNSGGCVQTLNKVYRDRIARETKRLREVISRLLQDDDLAPRVDDVLDGPLKMEGLGKAVVSHILMAAAPSTYALWNNKTEAGLERLECLPEKARGESRGSRYVRILQQLRELREITGARDFMELDLFLHFVGAPEPEGEAAIIQVTGAGLTHETPSEVAESPPNAEIFTQLMLPAPLERQLEDFIATNLDRQGQEWFGSRLRLHQDDESTGRQYQTSIGRIDLLARDDADNWVVVELKRGKSADAVLGQIQRYMGWVKMNLASGKEKVRGIIVVGDSERALTYALSVTTDVELYTYRMEFRLMRHQAPM